MKDPTLAKRERLKPHVVYKRNSVNQSDRIGPISIICLHSTESHNRPGNSDLVSIADYFNQSSTQASSHVVTDADGHSARCVPDKKKAWTCAGFNSPSLNIEQIGVAAEGHWSGKEIRESARWIAQWSILHDIPIRRGKVSGTQVIRSGVVFHSDLGDYGGGHSDPGSKYPLRKCLILACLYKAARKISRR